MNIKTSSQRGAILIIVLWFIVIVTIIVAVLANETRLSAQIVLHNKIGLQTWSDTLKALRAAEMELLLNDKLEDPPGTEVPLTHFQKKLRFDGRVLDLAYPIPETVTVRIYDQAGRINLKKLSLPNLKRLLKKRIGDDIEKMGELSDAWQDWTDNNDLKRLNGAEKDYYETLSPPYEPRNAPIETVEELLLIKGFAEVFKDVEMDTVFTVYGNKARINPNLATREALMLLGIDEESVNTILTQRREQEFKSYNDFNEFMEPEQLAEIQPWLNFHYTTRFYTIAVQVKKPEEIEKLANDDDDDKSDKNNSNESSVPQQEKEQAYMITVQFRGTNRKPKKLMVNPYGVLPDTRHEHLSNDDD
jgi:general secretion pathway protein K